MPESLREKIHKVLLENLNTDGDANVVGISEALEAILVLFPQATGEVKECWDSKQFWGEYVKKDKRIAELTKALEHIVENQRAVAGSMFPISTVYKIASDALKNRSVE